MKVIRILLIGFTILIGSIFINNLSINAVGETELPVFNTLSINNAAHVTFSPDSNLIFTAGESRSYIWHVGSGRNKEINELNFETIKNVAFSPDSKILAVSGYHQIWLFDSQSGDLLKTIEDKDYGGITILPESLSFSNDGKLLLIGIRFDRISVIDMSTFKESLAIPISGTSQRLRFNPKQNEFAAAGVQDLSNFRNSTLQIRNAGTGEIVKSFGNFENLFDMNYSHDGKYLIVSFKGYLEEPGSHVYDVEKGYEKIAEIEDYGSVSFTNDSKLAVIGNTVYLVDEQFQQSYDIKVENSDQGISPELAILSLDGKYLATNSGSAGLTILDAATLSVHLTDIELEPNFIALGVNESQPLKLMGTYSDRTKKVINTQDVKWSVKDFHIADVQESILMGQSIGSSTLTAKYGNLTTTIQITVADAPTDLKASFEGDSVKLQWTAVNTSDKLLGYNLYRRKANESYKIAPITDFPIQMNEYTDATTTKDQNYYYKVTAVYKNQVESQSVNEFFVTSKGKLIILQVDNPFMTVNGETKEVDTGNGTKPTIINGRTLLPIRSLIEELGGIIDWSGEERKVTVQLNDSKIELWIDKKIAIVNGNEEELDVVPTIINGRTMIPLRFVTENLGLLLHWEAETKTITLSYNDSKWYDMDYIQPLSEQFGKYIDGGVGYTIHYPLAWGTPEVAAIDKYYFKSITTFYKSDNNQIISFGDALNPGETYEDYLTKSGYDLEDSVSEATMKHADKVYYINTESDNSHKFIIVAFKLDQVLVIENSYNAESLTQLDQAAIDMLKEVLETLEIDQAVG